MQTIEMFEVITQSQPLDCQSLEILKEAYTKLEREDDLIRTAHRIAQAYVQLGQLSSAILEYESILQRHPEDPRALQALAEIENAANSLQAPDIHTEPARDSGPHSESAAPTPVNGKHVPTDLEDGRNAFYKLFVDGKVVNGGDFDSFWPVPYSVTPGKIADTFVQALAERGNVPVDRSLKLLVDKARLAYLPLEKYDIDLELARSFPADLCRRWCVLPFDRMSKSVLVATANPFNRTATQEFEDATPARLIWYLCPPQDIAKGIKRAFR